MDSCSEIRNGIGGVVLRILEWVFGIRLIVKRVSLVRSSE